MPTRKRFERKSRSVRIRMSRSPAGQAHDQGHAQAGVVRVLVVLPARVFEKLLAVIRRQQDGGVLGEPATLDLLEQPADPLVDPPDLTVVEPGATLRLGALRLVDLEQVETRKRRPGGSAVEDPIVGRRRQVRSVNVEVVEEEEERAGGERVEQLDGAPVHERGADEIGRADEAAEPIGRGRKGGLVVVDAPALGEPVLPRQERHGRNDPGRTVTERRQSFGEGLDVFVQRFLEAFHAVLVRIEAGEHRHVRGKGPVRRAPSPLENDTFAGEPIDIRARRARVAVGRQVVGAQRVDRDQNEVGWCVARATGEHEGGQPESRKGPVRPRRSRFSTTAREAERLTGTEAHRVDEGH